MGSYLLLIAAAFTAGVINSLAGGGSLLTFPALVFTGVPSIIANASSTVALTPGSFTSTWVYRHDLHDLDDFPFWPMMGVSFAGGILGALLLLHTSQRSFDAILPWLMLGATLIFAFGPRVSPILQRTFHVGPIGLISMQFAVAIYGGYFGGAIGILMLASWSLFGLTKIHAMNANKAAMATVMNGVALVLFVIARKVWWPQTLVMAAGGIIGGYVGAHGAKRVNPLYARRAVTMIGLTITIIFFLRRY